MKNKFMSKELESILITKQINPTAMRLLVLEFLLKQKTAISLSDLETEFERSDRTTLYRTLKTFEEKGMIHDINDGNESIKYAICEADCKDGVHRDMHVHFYCTNCKELFCLPKTQIPEIILPDKFQLQEFSLVARGRCNKCS
jgi:Fur family ferric uptake transcriptional regulator